MKKLVLLMIFFYSSLSYANLATFGLEINKTTRVSSKTRKEPEKTKRIRFFIRSFAI